MAEDKKIFDVTKPDKTKADPTSKLVIIGHRVAVNDGTVTPVTDSETTKPVDPLTSSGEEVNTASEDSKLNPVGEKKLSPSAELIEQVKQDKASGKNEAKEVGETKSALPQNESGKEEPKPDKEEDEQKDKPAKTEEPSKPAEKPYEKPAGNEAAVNTVLGEAGTVKEAEIAELERQEKIKKLVDEGKYELPIGQPKAHHNKVGFVKGLLILIVVFILTVAGFALAMDAELIKTNYKLPFDLIKVHKTEQTSQTPTPTPQPTTTTPKTTSTFVVPKDWVNYKMQNTDITLSHPSDWKPKYVENLNANYTGTKITASTDNVASANNLLKSDFYKSYDVSIDYIDQNESRITDFSNLSVLESRQITQGLLKGLYITYLTSNIEPRVNFIGTVSTKSISVGSTFSGNETIVKLNNDKFQIVIGGGNNKYISKTDFEKFQTTELYKNSSSILASLR